MIILKRLMIRITSGKSEVYSFVPKQIDISPYIQGTKNHYVKIVSARDADYFPVNEEEVYLSSIQDNKFTIYSSVMCDVKWELYGENDIESIMEWHPMA